MILILTAPNDAHADRIEPILAARRHPYLRVDPALFPISAQLSVRLRAGVLTRTLRVDGHDYDLGAVGAIWRRRPNTPVPSPELPAGQANFVAAESSDFVNDVWETMEVVQFPATRSVLLRSQQKVRQLQLAARLGFEVPDTAVGNAPDDLFELYDRHDQIITKQCGLTELGDGSDRIARFTVPVRAVDLLHASSVRSCPVIIQAYVPKAVELRVTVVGDQVFAAAIHSQRTRHTRHDWRRYDPSHTPLEPYDLPPEVALRCRMLVRRLGLHYGAFDLIVTPDQRHVFVEVNPSGQYLWVEDGAGLPITEAIADYLIAADLLHRVESLVATS
jgi:hypothetical protein